MPEKDRKVVRVARSIFPGGKAVLVGYNAAGDFVIGLGVKTKKVVAWARNGWTAADRRRVEAAAAELDAEVKAREPKPGGGA